MRILVDGPDVLPAVRRLQDGFKLSGAAAEAAAAPPAPVEDNGASFVAVVNAALSQNPSPPADARELARIATVGLGGGLQPPLADWNHYLPVAHKVLQHAIAGAKRPINGWTYPPADIGNF